MANDKLSELSMEFAVEIINLVKRLKEQRESIISIVKILEHGTGVVYLGFPECPWCQAYVPMLNEVADIEGLEKIYYFNDDVPIRTVRNSEGARNNYNWRKVE